MKRGTPWLQHIRNGQTAFNKNSLIQDTVIRNLEIIGETAMAMSLEFRAAHACVRPEDELNIECIHVF